MHNSYGVVLITPEGNFRSLQFVYVRRGLNFNVLPAIYLGSSCWRR
jgi:hypothetical protein